MFAPKRILVPVDFSACSKRALTFAYDLAQGAEALVDIMHVWQPPSFVSPDLLVFDPEADSVSLRDWVRDEASRSLHAFMEEMKPPEGVRVEFWLEHGDPAETIERVVETSHPDLVVMGTHGRTGMARLLAGSVAERTVRRAACPVLTVPPER
jgi:nucleotide-binding universal stress UspA family protein